MSGRTARVLFRSALTRKLQTAVRFQSFTGNDWKGLLAEVGTGRLAGRSISSGCCFPVTFISRTTAFSVRSLRREFLKSFIQPLKGSVIHRRPAYPRRQKEKACLKSSGVLRKRKNRKTAVRILRWPRWCPLQGRTRSARCCSFLPGSAPTVSTQRLLCFFCCCCCSSSVCMTPHLLPVLLLTIPASNHSTLTRSLMLESWRHFNQQKSRMHIYHN